MLSGAGGRHPRLTFVAHWSILPCAVNDRSYRLTESLPRVRISAEQNAQVRALAERDDRSVGAIVRRAIRELLEREAQREAA